MQLSQAASVIGVTLTERRTALGSGKTLTQAEGDTRAAGLRAGISAEVDQVALCGGGGRETGPTSIPSPAMSATTTSANA